MTNDLYRVINDHNLSHLLPMLILFWLFLTVQHDSKSRVDTGNVTGGTGYNLLRDSTGVEQRTSSLCPHVGPRQRRSVGLQHFGFLLISCLTVVAAKSTVTRYKNFQIRTHINKHFHCTKNNSL